MAERARVAATLSQATHRLAAVSDTPRLDAELLLAHALGLSREALLLDPARAVPSAFAALVERRLAHEPVAYITGTRDFWTISLSVGPGVLIPRADSETVIQAAVARFGTAGPATILDLGTGPGTLLLAALTQWQRARGLGVDISSEALAYARANASALGLAERAAFAVGTWSGHEAADLILCNPPYIEEGAPLAPQVARYEPAAALYAGANGLDAYRALIPALPGQLRPGGVAVLEIGAGQASDVGALAVATGFAVTPRRDLGGHVRALTLSI